MRWTIIVCTFNRAADLAECLPKLGQLGYPRDGFEILVVDNASSDDTPEVIRAAAATISNLRSIREEKPGLSCARNAGIEAARGELVAFIDDDAWPEAGWLQALEAGFADEKSACVGGKVAAVWPEQAPDWLTPRLYGFFSVVDYGGARLLSYPNYPAGTNIAFRKGALQKVGGFDEELGRIGESLLSMEEVDICLRLQDAGEKVCYVPDAVVHHKIHPNRISREWISRRSYSQGVSAALLETRRFTRSQLAVKAVKYLAFIVGGTLGKAVFSAMGNEKLAFFCGNQVTLCAAYLKQSLHGSRRS